MIANFEKFHALTETSIAQSEARTQGSITKLRNETQEHINDLRQYTQEGFGLVRLEIQKLDKKITLWGLSTLALYLATNGQGITHWIKMVGYALK